MTEGNEPQPAKPSLARRFFATLGPGVITGAADDDPSGIATYSIAGAQFGTLFLWAALVTWPLMAAVQMMCARIGMVTGKGLGGVLRDRFPRPVLIVICFALLGANTLNISADLASMADGAEMLTGFDSRYFVVLFGVAITAATIWMRYHRFASILKWLSLSLGAYIVTAFLLHPRWLSVLRDTFTVSLPQTSEGWSMLVAILGTTISPYLFFWQASQEVEEERAQGRLILIRRRGATRRELVDRQLDVGTGTFFSNVVMFFIILTTSMTLHAHGQTHIETSRQAAEALRPLAGHLAATLYTVGIFGVGALAIPTLAGSAAYAFAETFKWREGLDEKPRQAWEFYSVLVLSTALGIVFAFLHVSAIKILFWSAVINGLLAPFLLVAILILASDATTMCGQPSSRLSRIVVGLTAILMFGAAIGMFVF